MRKICNVVSVIAGLLVFALCISGILLKYGADTEPVDNGLKSDLPILFIGLFAIVGSIMFLRSVVRIAYRKKHCTYVTEAVCTEVRRKLKENGTINVLYTPILDFDYEGEKVRICNSMYSGKNSSPHVGSIETIHADVDKFEDYYISKPSEGLIEKLVIGLIAALPSLAILIYIVVIGLIG